MKFKDKSIIVLLTRRAGQVTFVRLENGNVLRVLNIAYGYDMGDDFAHVTTNISPSIEGESVDFFSTSKIAEIIDPENKEVLFKGFENCE
jgi:hypothetical protein